MRINANGRKLIIDPACLTSIVIVFEKNNQMGQLFILQLCNIYVMQLFLKIQPITLISATRILIVYSYRHVQ